MRRLRRPKWAFWTLGGTVFFTGATIFTVAIQAYLPGAVFAGLCASCLLAYRRHAHRHRSVGARLVEESTRELLEDRELEAVPRGLQTRGILRGVPVEVYLGMGHEAGLLPYFTLSAERPPGHQRELTDAEHEVVLAWLRRLAQIEVERGRVRMQFAAWPEHKEQVDLLLQALVNVVQELEAAEPPA